MVVHGDDLDWLSQKPNEKLELVQRARLGLVNDSEATVRNRCVAYNGSGLTWEADPRHAELAVAELRLQATRPQTSPGGATPSAPLDHEELELDGQKACDSVSARLAYLAADRLDIAFACKECSRAVGKVTRADLTRLERIGRYLLHTPRIVWEFPLQTEVTQQVARTLDIWRMLARRSTHFINLVVDTESGVTQQRAIRVPQHGTRTLCE